MMRRMENLLLIEDDHRLAQMVVEYLQQSGYAVHHAATAQEGLDALAAHPPHGARAGGDAHRQR